MSIILLATITAGAIGQIIYNRKECLNGIKRIEEDRQTYKKAFIEMKMNHVVQESETWANNEIKRQEIWLKGHIYKQILWPPTVKYMD
jgi:hypothetical protein